MRKREQRPDHSVPARPLYRKSISTLPGKCQVIFILPNIDGLARNTERKQRAWDPSPRSRSRLFLAGTP